MDVLRSLRVPHSPGARTIAGYAQSITSAVGNFGQVNTNDLCVGSTCVTPAQFQAIVATANQAGGGSADISWAVRPTAGKGLLTFPRPARNPDQRRQPRHHPGRRHLRRSRRHHHRPASRPQARNTDVPQRRARQQHRARYDPSRNRHHRLRRDRPKRHDLQALWDISRTTGIELSEPEIAIPRPSNQICPGPSTGYFVTG
jgi:hypothetical protein